VTALNNHQRTGSTECRILDQGIWTNADIGFFPVKEFLAGLALNVSARPVIVRRLAVRIRLRDRTNHQKQKCRRPRYADCPASHADPALPYCLHCLQAE